MSVCKHMEVRGQRPVSSSVRLSLNQQLLGLARLASQQAQGIMSFSPVPGSQASTAML